MVKSLHRFRVRWQSVFLAMIAPVQSTELFVENNMIYILNARFGEMVFKTNFVNLRLNV